MSKNKNVLNTYRERALERISTDEKEYHRFLEYCGRGNIHKLSFNSQLVLFWQKPFATIIAGFDAWNRGAGNRILFGSHGAGIYEEPGMSFKGNLERNVFDITETDNKNPVLLWQLRVDKREGLATYLAGSRDLVDTIRTAVCQYLNGMLHLEEGAGIKEQIQNSAVPKELSREEVTDFIRDSILEMVLRRMGYEGESAFAGDYSRIFTALDKEERKGFLKTFAMYASHAAKAVTLFFRDQIYQLEKEKNTERKQTDGDKGNDDGRGIFHEPAEGAYGGGDQAETLPGEETVRPDAVYLPFGEAGAFVSVLDPDRGDAPGVREDRGEGQGDVKPGDHGVPETPQEPYREPVRGSEAHREGQGDILGAGHQGDRGSADVGEAGQTEDLLSEKDKEDGMEDIPARDFYYDMASEEEERRGRGYGSKAAFLDNAAAIRLLKELEEEERNATPMEQAVLSRYAGWGGLPQAFDPKNETWKKEYQELKGLLTEEEYQAARASTVTAFYTDRKVIEVLYEKLMDMGFLGGNILEPAMGTGNFYSAMPKELRETTVKYGVELDPVSARIAKKLHPSAHIETGGFENSRFGKNLFDVVVGNVPFGDFKVYDPRHKREDFTIHNYFFVKALDLVRAGGIIAFITSTGTMDALDGRAREYLAARADLLGAVRLPDNTFSTTRTASDIIFLQKRQDIRYDLPDWTVSKKEMVDIQTGKAVSHFEQYVPLLTVFTEHTYETVLDRAFEKEKEDAVRFAVEEYLTYTPKAEVMDVLSQHFVQGYAWISSRLVDLIEYDREKALRHLSKIMEGEGSYQEIYDLAEQYGETKKGTELNVSARRLKNSSGHTYHTYQEFFETLAASSYENLKKAVHNEILGMVLRKDPVLFGKDAAAAEGMEEMTMNQYFAVHPEMILGKMRYMPGKFGEDSRYTACVNDEEGFVIEDALREACKSISGDYQSAIGQETYQGDIPETIPAPSEQKNFTYMVSEEGKLYYKNNSVLIPYQADKPKNISRIKKLVQLKETEKELLNIQLEGCTDKEFEEKCRELNTLYDDFVKTEKYHVGDNFIAQIMSDDVEYPLLCALEDRDEEGNISKADIFKKRTVHPRESFDRIETPVDALNVSINKLNRVDLAFMGRLLGERDLKKITEELKGMIYLNPAKYLENDYTAGWETAEEYLSGNVRDKLRVAELYMEKAPELFAGNKEALEKNLPEWLDASLIEVHLGTPWIEDEVYRQFIVELLNPRPYLEQATRVERFSGNNSYKVSGASDYSFLSSATESYGTSRMNGAQIIENLLNLRTIEIRDKIYDAIKEKDVYVVNAQETAAAQAKADLIKEKFKEWFWQDMGRREKYEAYYNNTFNNVKLREYDGSMLTFDGISSQIELRPHQKDAVARAVRGRNTLLAHCVGAGKTFEMECACMELKRLGLASKPLMVVPNHLTSQTASEFLRLYPSANLLLTHKKDFEKKNRKVFISKIATGDYDCVIMGFSQFEKISMSPEYEKHMLERQKQEMIEAIRTMERDKNKNFSVKQIEKNLKSTEERIKKLMDAPVRDDMIYFENLGIDCLIVDEAHEYKNLGITSKMEWVAGVPQQSAQKAFDLYMKKSYIEDRGGKIIFATGTPVSNTMAEMYVMMKYLYEREMEQMGITCFDAWAAIFGEVVPMFELKAAGDGYRTTNRFARFVNVPELMTMYKSFADIVLPEMIDLDVPGLKDGKYTIVQSLPDEAVKEKMEEFAARADMIHNGMVSPREDNMLNITNEARLLGTDIRLLDENEEGYEGSKLNLAVENICRIYREFQEEKGTQIVFSDIGTPTGRHPFNVYDYIRDGCIRNGIPAEEIAYIHDADTEKKKDELFAAMRNGTVRLLIGSTAKMGTGMNVQKRVCALHEIDVPWRPADVEQREGRAIRQGNMFEEVEIFRYVTKQTFDAYSYQMLERKQGFISQVMGRDSVENRTCEDIDNKSMSYAEIKSLASGNPLIEEKFKVDAEVLKLKLLKQQHMSNKYRMEAEVKRHIPEEIRKLKERIENVSADLKIKNAMLNGEGISVTIGKETYRLMDLANMDEIYRKQRKRAGEAILAYAALADGQDKKSVEFGEIGDFKLSVDSDIYGNEKSLVISGRAAYAYQIGKDAHGNAAKLWKNFNAIGSDLGILEERAERYKANLETLKQEVEKPFEKEEELAFLIKRQAELNVELSKDKRDETKEQGEGSGTFRHTVQR